MCVLPMLNEKIVEPYTDFLVKVILESQTIRAKGVNAETEKEMQDSEHRLYSYVNQAVVEFEPNFEKLQTQTLQYILDNVPLSSNKKKTILTELNKHD